MRPSARPTNARAALLPRVAILDYGMGNLRSVEKALEHVGAQAPRTRDHEEVRRADGVILPGVGAFPAAMKQVRRFGFDELVRERLASRIPVLGICLGMQLLFEHSEELGGAEGIGVLPGLVKRLDADSLKLPQIGWNPVSWRQSQETPSAAPPPLHHGLPDPCAFYHVHSFAARPRLASDVLGTATYGGEFASAVERGPVSGVQFHPEKSGPHGLQLLQNFVRVCAGERSMAA